MKKGKISVDGKELKGKIQMPSYSKLLKLSAEEIEDTLAVNIVEGDEHHEKSSHYLSFAQKVKHVEDVNKGLAKLRVKYADAMHISCAYRLKKSAKPQDQGYEDDMEIGVGRSILSAIQNKSMSEICVYMVRYYGGIHLGNRRYEIAKDLALSAIRSFKAARHLRINQLQSLQRSVSQASLDTEVSFQSGQFAESLDDEDLMMIQDQAQSGAAENPTDRKQDDNNGPPDE